MKLKQISTVLAAGALTLAFNQASAKTAETVQVVDPTQAVTAQVCKITTQDEIRALFTRWNDSLKTLDPAKVTNNYADDAVLLPTVSNKPRTNHAEINDYFVHFLQKKPQGVINKSHVNLGCNRATDVGVYTFTLHGKDGKPQQVVARYSYVYVYKNGQWLIEHHHSSAMPEAITQKSH